MADLAIQILAAAIPKAVAVVRQLTKAKTNKKHFELLAERIQSTAATLEKLKEQGVPIKGVVRTGLNDFISVLDSANDLLNDYEFSSKVKRVVKANNLRDKIRLMNERLSHAQQNLNFALCVEQRSPSHTGNTGMNLMSWQEGGGGATVPYPSAYTQVATTPCLNVYVGGGGGTTIIYPGSYTQVSATPYPTGYVAGAWGNLYSNVCPSGVAQQVVCTPYGVSTAQTVVAPFWR